MSTELKIGIGIGIIVVVVGVIFLLNRPPEAPILSPLDHNGEPPMVQVPSPPPPETPGPAPVNPPPATSAPPAPAAPLTGQPSVPAPLITPPSNPSPPVTIVPLPTTPEARYHVVKKGESLERISELYYGEARHFTIIQQANRDLVKDPNKLQAGWKLRIPYPGEIAGQ